MSGGRIAEVIGLCRGAPESLFVEVSSCCVASTWSVESGLQ